MKIKNFPNIPKNHIATQELYMYFLFFVIVG